MSNEAAWITEKQAKPLKVDKADKWKPGPHELLIKNHAFAINPVDWKVQESGRFIDRYPNIMGSDISGEVEEVGEGVAHFKKGQRVLAFAMNLQTQEPKKGAFQKYTIVDEGLTAAIPDSLPYENAAAMPLAVSTAAVGLYMKDHLGLPYPSTRPKPTGKTILIYGGSSSVGGTAIQMAVASGLTVATTASSHNTQYVKSLGAKHVFDHSKSGLVEEVVTALKGSDFVGVYDAIALPDTAKRSAEIARQLGTPKVVTTLPPPDDLPEGVKVAGVWAALIPNDKNLVEAIWGKWLPEALANGSLQCKPEPLTFDGLEKTQDAFDKQKEGVSAKKVVVVIK